MNDQANAFKLGLFVLVSAALLLAGLAALGAGAFLRRTTIVESYFEESVQGLDVGADVKLRGVRVGRVSRIGFVNDRYPIAEDADRADAMLRGLVLIEMELDERLSINERLIERFDRAIDGGLRARLSSAGLMGVGFIELVFLEPDRHPPITITWTPDRPYVPATLSVIGTLKDTLQQIGDHLANIDFDALVSRLERVFDELDLGDVKGGFVALVEELRGSNTRLRAILDSPQIDATLDNAAGAMAGIRRMTDENEADLRSFIESLPDVADRARATLARLDALAEDPALRRALDGLAATTDAAAPAAAEARILLRRLTTMVAAQEQDLAAIVTSLRRVLDNADAITEDASRHPSRLLFGEPPPRVNPTETERNTRP